MAKKVWFCLTCGKAVTDFNPGIETSMKYCKKCGNVLLLEGEAKTKGSKKSRTRRFSQ